MNTELVITATGTVRAIYSETICFQSLGQPSIRRASHVEPTEGGQWIADLSPVGGPKLGPYTIRSKALHAEVEWLQTHWLANPSD
ncbi:hypothetical protein CGZ80_17550 [Rhodopirellula sp. MGV]|nr:hypothetical protein CGZ80_17550 [Rhodopirellula sp. MGV]PNY37266.1 hypothetical protein C2E31_08850 [Rhodopirellula baltica]